MKTHFECIPCFVRQALEASKMATSEKSIQEKSLKKVLLELSKTSFEQPPTQIAHIVHHIVKEVTKNPDPYKKIKERDNRIAMELYQYLKQMVSKSKKKLLTATKLAIAGNIIDYGPSSNFNIKNEIKTVLNQKLAVNDFPLFKEKLKNAENIVYLGDNTGEIVFDRVLLEEIGDRKITFFVKAEPILNDALMEDAKLVGIDKLADIKTIGINKKGLKRDSKEFLRLLKNADIVISKGQGNYETLSDVGSIFFLLKVKCPVVATDIPAKVGDMVLASL